MKVILQDGRPVRLYPLTPEDRTHPLIHPLATHSATITEKGQQVELGEVSEGLSGIWIIPGEHLAGSLSLVLQILADRHDRRQDPLLDLADSLAINELP
jgi:hypothetical protein